MSRIGSASRLWSALLALATLGAAESAYAAIPGVSGATFTLTAKEDRISTPDGHSIYFWGFSTPASMDGHAQYPGPTLKVAEGATVSITVKNELPATFQQAVSLVVAGQSGVTASCDSGGCVQGPITLEAPSGKSVTYSFTASRPGTFLYNSGSHPDLQVEMGLAGTLIVYPATAGKAYDDAAPSFDAGNPAGSKYDREYLFFLSEMDSEIHDLVEQQGVQAVYDSGRLSRYFPNYWFINGRNAPDTMAEDSECRDVAAGNETTLRSCGRLPSQPYGALTRVHPGDKVLMRVVGGGHDMHPFHHHGQHARVIAVDGHPLTSSAAASGYPLDLSHEVFTIQSQPGQTVDAILRWTGKGLGWDIYGHKAGDGSSCTATASSSNPDGLDPVTHEFCGDHLKPLPVILPEALALTNGPFYSGSPFLGQVGLMPPGDGGMNPNAGYTYMWHSHNEKEITNYDVFPGGMMTMLVVEPTDTLIP